LLGGVETSFLIVGYLFCSLEIFVPGWVPQTRINGAKERFLAEWLGQKVDRACAHNPCLQTLITVSGYEDDWDPAALSRQSTLQFRPTHTRHTHVENQAGCLL
jgi:hypothetical protein